MRDAINRSWIWAMVAFGLHNAEETWSIASGWSTMHAPELAWTAGWWPQFALVASLLTALLGGLAYALRSRPSVSRRVLVIFLYLMLANVVWHVAVSVYTASVAPGVVTAVVLLLPLYAILLRRLSAADFRCSPHGGDRRANGACPFSLDSRHGRMWW